MANIVIDIADILDGAFPELTKKQQSDCYKQVLFWEFESELGDYGLGEYVDHLAPKWANNNIGLQELYFQAVDNALINPSSTWEEESLNQKKYNQLSEWGRTKEAEEFAREKVEFPTFRRIFVDKAIKDHDYTTAKSLINQGIKLSRERQHPGTEADWREGLIDIAPQRAEGRGCRQRGTQLRQRRIRVGRDQAR